MMRSSFFVVLYAEFLIITQYIYGMNIYENELPTKVMYNYFLFTRALRRKQIFF